MLSRSKSIQGTRQLHGASSRAGSRLRVLCIVRSEWKENPPGNARTKHCHAGGRGLNVWSDLSFGFSIALLPQNLLAATVGAIIGTLVGVLPGLGPAGAIAILLPLTFGLDVSTALVMLAGIYYGSMYGGSITSILVKVPGEAASVVTTIEG